MHPIGFISLLLPPSPLAKRAPRPTPPFSPSHFHSSLLHSTPTRITPSSPDRQPQCCWPMVAPLLPVPSAARPGRRRAAPTGAGRGRRCWRCGLWRLWRTRTLPSPLQPLPSSPSPPGLLGPPGQAGLGAGGSRRRSRRAREGLGGTGAGDCCAGLMMILRCAGGCRL